jgi:hypothetical protein
VVRSWHERNPRTAVLRDLNNPLKLVFSSESALGCFLWGMDGAEPIRIAEINVPPEQRTPLVEVLLWVTEQQWAEIVQLRDEIAGLKGLPRCPAIRPSDLNSPHPDLS